MVAPNLDTLYRVAVLDLRRGPTPAGAFTLTLGIYLPEPSVLDGSYPVPAVQLTIG